MFGLYAVGMCSRYVLATPAEVVKFSQLLDPTPPRVRPLGTAVPQPELAAALAKPSCVAAAIMIGNESWANILAKYEKFQRE